jgi:serine/threonine-protein kinase SRPK3
MGYSRWVANPLDPSSSSPRYRILHKLGQGWYATVWLARDLLPPGFVRCILFPFAFSLSCAVSRFVTLNIVVSELSEGCREAYVLKFFAEQDSGVGPQYILNLLDKFQIKGPNGSHEVLVTDVMASLSALAQHPVYKKVR